MGGMKFGFKTNPHLAPFDIFRFDHVSALIQCITLQATLPERGK